MTNALSRRTMLKCAGGGFGYLALAGLLGETAARAAEKPLAAKLPHFRTKAKRIIFLFMEGAMSQMDSWEYKSRLQAEDSKPGPGGGTLVASKFKFKQHGRTGTWVSELFPHLARHVDKLCFLRGLHTDTPAHPQAVIQLHTGTGATTGATCGALIGRSAACAPADANITAPEARSRPRMIFI